MQTKETIKKIVDDQGIELTRFLYTDNDGISRGYSSTTDSLSGDLDSGNASAIAMPLFSAHDDIVPESMFGPVGELIAMC